MQLKQSFELRGYSPEFELVLRVLRNELMAVDIARLVPQLDWDYLLSGIVRHRVVEQLLAALAGIEAVPPRFLAALRQINSQIKLSVLGMNAETIRIIRQFDLAQLPYILVKGLPLALEVYAGADRRQFKDIDVWVKPADLDQALGILITLGYTITYPNYALSGYKKEYFLSSRHDIQMTHRERGVEVELHFRLAYFQHSIFAFSEVETKVLQLKQQAIVTLEENYHLFYLLVHGAVHAWSRLRWLNDIALFVSQNKCDLAKVYQLGLHKQLSHAVLQGLWLLRDIYGIQDAGLDQLLENADARVISLAKSSKQFLLADYEQSAAKNRLFKWLFFKYRLYLAKSTTREHYMSAVVDDIFKIDTLFPSLNLPRRFRFMYYLLAPLRHLFRLLTLR